MSKPDFKEWAKQQKIDDVYSDYPSYCARFGVVDPEGSEDEDERGQLITTDKLEEYCHAWYKMGRESAFKDIEMLNLKPGESVGLALARAIAGFKL